MDTKNTQRTSARKITVKRSLSIIKPQDKQSSIPPIETQQSKEPSSLTTYPSLNGIANDKTNPRFVFPEIGPKVIIKEMTPSEALSRLVIGQTASGKSITLDVSGDFSEWTFKDHKDAHHLIWLREGELTDIFNDFSVPEFQILFEVYAAASMFHMDRRDPPKS